MSGMLKCRHWAQKLKARVSPAVISLADTVGTASAEVVESVFYATTLAVGRECLGLICTFAPMEGLDKIKRAIVAAFGLTAHCVAWVAAPWHRTTSLAMHTEWIVEWAEKRGYGPSIKSMHSTSLFHWPLTCFLDRNKINSIRTTSIECCM